MRTLAGASDALELAAAGAWFLASHSGGKDSQAQYAALLRLGIPEAQIIVVHADLGAVEHRGTLRHIVTNVRPAHRDLVISRATFRDGTRKDFLGVVRQRRATLDRTGREHVSAAPTASERYCTSDLKTGPIWRDAKAEIRRRQGRPGGIIVNCVGIRAQEGGNRSKRVSQRPANQLTIAKAPTGQGTLWTCYDWWPLAHWSEQDVWAEIHAAGQRPHPSYGYCHDSGRATLNQRLSCEFCVFGSPNDIRLAAQRRPELLVELVQLEADIRGPLHISRKPLAAIVEGC